MKEQELYFNYKARYYTQGELTTTTKKIWFVLHGYGQLAKFFTLNAIFINSNIPFF